MSRTVRLVSILVASTNIPITRLATRLLYSAGFSLVLLAGFLHVIATRGEEVNLTVVYEALRGIPGALIGLFVLIQLLVIFLRALRYQVIFRAQLALERPSFRQLVFVTGVRNMVVDLLPARLGELVFVLMLNRGCRVPVARGLAVLTISLVADILILVPVILVMGLLPLALTGLTPGLIPAGFALCGMTVAAVGIAWKGLPWLATQLDRRAPDRLRRIVQFLTDFKQVLDQCLQQRILMRLLLLSVVLRFLKYYGLYLLFTAVTGSAGLTVPALNALQSLAALVASEAAASLPIPALMGFGTYEAGGFLVLTLLGYSAVMSLITMLTVHIAAQVVDYLLGCGCLALFFLIVPRQVRPAGSKFLTARVFQFRYWALVFAGAVFAVGLVLIVGQYDRVQKGRSQLPPPVGQAVVRPLESLVSDWTDQDLPRGWMVWSSNRFGNHDILQMHLPNGRITRLTQHPHSEYFPRISPDGRQLVFARSREAWVSQRDPVPWNVFLLDLESGRERQLAEFATSPTWSENGDRVYFQRGTDEFVELDLASGRERVLYRAGEGRIPARVEFSRPSYNLRRTQMAVTWRGARRMTVTVGLDGNLRPIGQGCQLTWAPDGGFLYWVDHGGLMQNQIYKQARGTDEARSWLDLPVPYSHEYFPRLSRDGRYLVLGASRGGHEHDVADYEIFLWPVGARPERAIRLTWHTGNDSWPDLFLQ